MPARQFVKSHLRAILSAAFCIGAAAVAVWLAVAPKPWAVVADDPELQKLRSIIRYYGWIAAAVNGVLLVLLGATVRIWIGQTNPAVGPWLTSLKTPRWFVPVLSAAVLATFFFGIQRMGQSLWGDEEDSVRTYVHGEWMLQEDGTLKFRKPGWEHTFFNHRRATNHQFQSILSRVAHETWVAISRPKGLGLSETAMRVPVLLAGMAAVAVIGILLLRLGLPHAGVLAAWLLAIHPWFIRYSTELRGYAFAMLFIPLLLLLLLNALDRRTWPAWLAFGLCGLLTLYSHASTLYVLVLTNLLGLAAVVLRNPPGARLPQAGRLLVVNVLAGMVYLQLMLPCVPQLASYLASDTMQGVLTPRWHANLGAHFFTGIPWDNSDSSDSGLLEFKWLAENGGPIFPAAFVACFLLLLIGTWILAGTRPAGWIVTLVFAIPPLVVYGMARVQGNYLYEWYLIPALPGVVAAVATGFDAVCSPLARIHTAARWTVMVLALAAYGALTSTAREWLLENPVQPMRESVLAIRPSLDPFDPLQTEILTARLNAPARSYDPHAILIDTVDGFVELMRRADSEAKPLFVNYGNIHSAAVDFPEVHAIIEDDRIFEKFPTMPGLDPTLERYIRRYQPGTVKLLQQSLTEEP